MFELIESIGVVAFAINGFLVAIKRDLDLLGVFISMFLTALGGGLARDVILGLAPYSFTHTLPPLLVLIVLLIMILFKLHTKIDLDNNRLIILSDSLGLVAFSINGALLAINSGYNLAGVLSLAFITGVGGGIARDVIINQIPQILTTGFYGSVTLIVGLILYLFNQFATINFYIILITLIFGFILRVIAYKNSWHIPKI